MKWMYVVLMMVVLIVAFICYSHVSVYVDLSYARNLLTPDQERLDHLINRNFAKVTAVLEIIAIAIGILGLKTRKKTSIFIIITSLPMLFWSYLMYQNPAHISIDEVVLAWIIYIMRIKS